MLRTYRYHKYSARFRAVLTISSSHTLLPYMRCSVLPPYLGCTLLSSSLMYIVGSYLRRRVIYILISYDFDSR